MTWSYVKYPTDSEDSIWLLVEDGNTVDGPYTCGLAMICRLVDGLNLLDRSREAGAVQAFQEQVFEVVFTPQAKRRARASR